MPRLALCGNIVWDKIIMERPNHPILGAITMNIFMPQIEIFGFSRGIDICRWEMTWYGSNDTSYGEKMLREVANAKISGRSNCLRLYRAYWTPVWVEGGTRIVVTSPTLRGHKRD